MARFTVFQLPGTQNENNATANSAVDPCPVLGYAKIRGVLWRDLCFGHCASEQKGKRGKI
jgi:hypothetical protein